MKLSLPSAGALLHLAAACWLFLQLAPSVRWLPSDLNGPAAAVGAVCALIAIALVLLDVIKTQVGK